MVAAAAGSCPGDYRRNQPIAAPGATGRSGCSRTTWPVASYAPRTRTSEEGADLLGREVHDGDHLPAHELLRSVIRRDLGARALDPERSEVDPQAQGGPPRLRKRPGLGDDTDTHVDFLKIRPRERH